MSLSRLKFTKEFKEEAVRRLDLGASLAEVARACEVHTNVLHRWRRESRDYGVKAFTGNGKGRPEETRLAELERKVGRQAREIDFLRRCLQHVEEQRKLPPAVASRKPIVWWCCESALRGSGVSHTNCFPALSRSLIVSTSNSTSAKSLRRFMAAIQKRLRPGRSGATRNSTVTAWRV
jgi:transposase